MKYLGLVLTLILNLLTTQALAQDKKPKVTVIEFSNSDKTAKAEFDPAVKQAAIKQNFEATKVDAEILGIDDKLENGVHYLQ